MSQDRWGSLDWLDYWYPLKKWINKKEKEKKNRSIAVLLGLVCCDELAVIWAR